MSRPGSKSEEFTEEQVDGLRRAMESGWGIVETPTYRPRRGHHQAPEYDIACRSPLTRRQMLDQLDEATRAKRLAEIEAFTPDIDLDTPEVVRVTVHGYIDRTSTERRDWHSADGSESPRSYEEWLTDQVRMYVPAGYIPVGRWRDVLPLEAVAIARDAAEEAPRLLQETVRGALERGVSAVKIAETLGVTRARVYQLRDGR